MLLCFFGVRMFRFLICWLGLDLVVFSRCIRWLVRVWVVVCLKRLVLYLSSFFNLFGVLLVRWFLLIFSVKLNLVELILWICRLFFMLGRFSLVFGVFWNVNMIWNKGCVLCEWVGLSIFMSFLNGRFWFL